MITITCGEEVPHDDAILCHLEKHRRDLLGAPDQPIFIEVNGTRYKVYSQVVIEEITKGM